MKTFDIKQSFKSALNTLKARKGLYLGATVLIGIVLMALDSMSKSHSAIVGFVGALALIAMQFVVTAGSMNFILKDIKKESVTYNDFLPPNQTLARYIKAVLRFLLKLLPFGLLAALAGIGGVGIAIFSGNMIAGIISVCVLIVAAVFATKLIITYYFFGYISIEETISSKDSLAKAKALSDGNRWKLLGFLILVGFINLLGGITFIGWIFTVPITMIATGYVYTSLKGISVNAPHSIDTEKVEVVSVESTPEKEETIAPVVETV